MNKIRFFPYLDCFQCYNMKGLTVNDDDDIETSDDYFINLHSQYGRDTKEMEEKKSLEQLDTIRARKH